MDIPSDCCIAWFCRSTRPFQTFLVSNIGLLRLRTTKYVALPNNLGTAHHIPSNFRSIQPRSGIEKGENQPVWWPYFRLLTHTYHRFGLSVELCGDKCPSLLAPFCLFHHTYILGISLPAPILDNLLLVI